MALSLLYANDRAGRFPPSWYAETASIPAIRAPLKGDCRADVCIVGGGYTGLSAALHLATSGYRVVVLEAHRCGWGASGRNGGHAASGQRLDQDELAEQHGTEMARRLWDLAEEAKADLRTLIREHAIDCLPVDGIVHAAHKPRHVAELRDYAEMMQSAYGYRDIRFLDREETRSLIASPDYHGAVRDGGAFHLHPLRLAIGLADAAQQAGAVIYEQSEVAAIEHGSKARVLTNKGSVTADFVIVACNGYLGGIAPVQSRHVMPINNFIVATEPLGEDGARALIEDGSAVSDSRFVVNYFRTTHDHRLLFGGGETYGYRFPADIAALVRKPMLKVYPQLKDVRIDHAWGGTLAITMNRMPWLSRLAPNVLAAAGYSGHGVVMANFAGRLMAEAVRGQAERFDILAALPQSPFPGGPMMRWPLLVLAMSWYAMLDRL